MNTQTREEKGKAIFERGGVTRITETEFSVESDAGKPSYLVLLTACGEKCGCADCEYRREVCKHIHAARFEAENIVIN